MCWDTVELIMLLMAEKASFSFWSKLCNESVNFSETAAEWRPPSLAAFVSVHKHSDKSASLLAPSLSAATSSEIVPFLWNRSMVG